MSGMKCAIILPDGAADDPLPQLGGQTPLQAARIPHMDWIAGHGRLGRMRTIPAGFTPGTDVGTLALFGYDPHRYYTGRAPIEAAARGLAVGPDELIFRCNFVTVLDGQMKDFTADHISSDEGRCLVELLNQAARGGDAALRGCAFHAGVSYRNLMVMDGAAGLRVETMPPHDIPNRPIAEHLPRGSGAERVRAIMQRSEELFGEHAVNRARRAAGRVPVTGVWLWGQGRPTRLEPLAERYGVRGAVITAVDIIRGLAVLMGLDLLEVPGATGYLDTDYAAKGLAAVRALDTYDLVVVHVEAPDEAAHEGRAAEKVKALERTDEHIVGPLLAKLRANEAWRIAVAPDHVTSTVTTQHGAEPPPFCVAGSGVAAVEPRPFSEADAAAGGWMLGAGESVLGVLLAGR